MNVKQLIAAVVTLAAAGSLFAQTPGAGLTREQVKAELMQARANGEIQQSEADYARFPVTVSKVTREEVIAELVRARANGEIASGETDYPKMPQSTSHLTRAEVTAEMVRARKNGEMPVTNADFDVAQAKTHAFQSPN